jgi:hypothetical protein
MSTVRLSTSHSYVQSGAKTFTCPIDSAVLQYAQIVKLGKPTENQRKAMCEVLVSSSLNNGLGAFQSQDLAVDTFNEPMLYKKFFAKDLILLDSSEEENDYLVRWIVHPSMFLFHWIWRRRKVNETLLTPDN